MSVQACARAKNCCVQRVLRVQGGDRRLQSSTQSQCSNIIETSTGILYIIPIDTLTILDNAAILTAFNAHIDESKVWTQRSGATAISLPAGYTVLDDSQVQLGAILNSTSTPREVLISSFIPFSWDQMNSLIAAITSQQLNCASVCAAARATPRDIQRAVACGCVRRTTTLVASAEVVILGSGLDVASCAPKSSCAEEVQEMLFDAINTLVVKETLKACSGGQCQALSQIAGGGGSKSLRRLGSVSASDDKERRERQQNWQQDQLNKNAKNKSVKKKKGRRLQASQTQDNAGASLSFKMQLNTNLMAIASGGTVSTTAQISSLAQAVVAGLKGQVRLSAQKMMTVGYLNMKLQHVKAFSSFVTALANGQAQASGLANVDMTLISVDMVVPSGASATPPAPTPMAKPQPTLQLPPSVAIPRPTYAPNAMPTPKPFPQITPVRTPALPPKPVGRAPTQRPVKKPTTRPTRRPTPEPTESEYTDDEPPTSYTDDAQSA